MSQVSDTRNGLCTVDVNDTSARPEFRSASSNGPCTYDDNVISCPRQSNLPFCKQEEKELCADLCADLRINANTVGGLKQSTFWLILIFLAAFVIASSAVSAVGGFRASQKVGFILNERAKCSENISTVSNISTSSTTAIQTAITSTYLVGATGPPTRGWSDCPAKNGTLYRAVNPENGKPLDAQYQKVCGHPHDTGMYYLATAFVPTMDACIQICANINYWQTRAGSDVRCKVVNYLAGGVMPNNCWVSNVTKSMKAEEGWDSGTLVESSD